MSEVGAAKHVRNATNVATIQDGVSTVVFAAGEFDADSVSIFSDVIDSVVLDDRNPVVVDLSGVSFMGAAMVNAIVFGQGALQCRFRSLTVRTPSPIARRVLLLCDFAEGIELESTASGGANVDLTSAEVASVGCRVSTRARLEATA